MTSTTAATANVDNLATNVPSIPTSTQWICFSTSLRQTANIEWTENNFQPRNALYYVNKCYWGDLLPPGQSAEPEKLNVVIDDKIPSNKELTSNKAGDASQQLGRKDSVHIQASGTGLPSAGTGVTQVPAGGTTGQTSTGQGATHGVATAVGQPKPLKDGPKPPKQRTEPVVRLMTNRNIKIEGQTRIFIAAEYIEPDMQGGPMAKHHIRDLAGLTDEDDKEKNVWVVMQLNECVRYGQNGSGGNLSRWLVYHPPISMRFRAPRIFQHRFTGLTSAELAFAGVDLAVQNTPQEYAPIAEVIGKLAGIGINALKSGVGHYLHSFLNEEQVQEAEVLLQKVDVSRRSRLRLYALQIIEAKTIGAENMKEDPLTLQRIQEEAQHRAELKNMLNKKSWWFAQIFKKGKASRIATDKALAAGLTTFYDGDIGHLAMAKEASAKLFEASFAEIDEGTRAQALYQTDLNRSPFRFHDLYVDIGDDIDEYYNEEDIRAEMVARASQTQSSKNASVYGGGLVRPRPSLQKAQQGGFPGNDVFNNNLNIRKTTLGTPTNSGTPISSKDRHDRSKLYSIK